MSLGRGVPADILGAGSVPATWGVPPGWVHAIDLSTPARCEGTVRTCTPGKSGPAAVSLQTAPRNPCPGMCTPGCCPGAGRGAGTHGLLLPRRRPRFTSCGAPRTACPCRSTCLRTARSSHKCKRGHPHTHPGRGAQPGWPRDSGDQAVPRPPTAAWGHGWEAQPPPTSTPGVRGAGTGWPGLAPHSTSPHRHHDPDADGATVILDLGLWSLIKVVVGVLLPSPAPRDVSPLSPAPSPAGSPPSPGSGTRLALPGSGPSGLGSSCASVGLG